jgi:hypothetical protein
VPRRVAEFLSFCVFMFTIRYIIVNIVYTKFSLVSSGLSAPLYQDSVQ